RRRHTRFDCDWSSDVCSSDLISWGRLNKPSDALAVNQKIEAKVLKVDPAKRRISLGMKQLQPHPWDLASEKYKTGSRVNGTVTQIGRASCRERVEISAGCGGL